MVINIGIKPTAHRGLMGFYLKKVKIVQFEKMFLYFDMFRNDLRDWQDETRIKVH